MGGLLSGGSILAAFFGGAVALFSPCCIIFLLPSYMATGVKNRRWKLLPLTLVFASGLALVLLPITLGIGLLAQTLADFHTPLYVAGGLLLFAMAAFSLSGRSWSMPSFIHAPAPDRSDSAGVFALGVFSGIASSCCAPVLAGVMTLSALSSSVAGSATLGLAYIFGMVFPLFLLATFWDRLRLGERRLFQSKVVRLHALGRTFVTNTVNVVVAVVFAAMGGFVLYLAAAGNPMGGGGPQLAVGRWLTAFFTRALAFLDPVPQPILGLALLALAAGFIIVALRGNREAEPPTGTGGSCHEHDEGTTAGDNELASQETADDHAE
ncbi:MAG: cytochrome c biogenesis CcdA family protein, partial [Actinomycetota bacterium]|nr:cytochrome c biogenesis CcdA family protein [Actinomycetota bacterium]